MIPLNCTLIWSAMARDAQIDVTAKTVAHVANRENSMSGQNKIPQELLP